MVLASLWRPPTKPMPGGLSTEPPRSPYPPISEMKKAEAWLRGGLELERGLCDFKASFRAPPAPWIPASLLGQIMCFPTPVPLHLLSPLPGILFPLLALQANFPTVFRNKTCLTVPCRSAPLLRTHNHSAFYLHDVRVLWHSCQAEREALTDTSWLRLGVRLPCGGWREDSSLRSRS